MELEREYAYKFREGKAEGILEGAQQKAEEASINFLKKGISPEVIAECEGLSLEKVLELQESIKVMA